MSSKTFLSDAAFLGVSAAFAGVCGKLGVQLTEKVQALIKPQTRDLKLCFLNEVRRVRCPENLDQLESLARQVFCIPEHHGLTFMYTDEEQDCVTLATNADLQTAVHIEFQDKKKVLKLQLFVFEKKTPSCPLYAPVYPDLAPTEPAPETKTQTDLAVAHALYLKELTEACKHDFAQACAQTHYCNNRLDSARPSATPPRKFLLSLEIINIALFVGAFTLAFRSTRRPATSSSTTTCNTHTCQLRK